MGKYYVYHLIDPRTGSVFYVGKGCGNRLKHHEQDARLHRYLNCAKEDAIHAIWAEGLSVESKIVARFTNEASAYSFEREEIQRIGRERLTNITNGFEPDVLKAKKRATAFVNMMEKNISILIGKKREQAIQLRDEMLENIAFCDKVMALENL